jgi:CheY-like chemotaxis protein
MKKVLIVLNDAILRSVFKSWAFRAQKKDLLFFAKDSKEAIEVMKSTPIDLVMTELSLPEMDGVELASCIAVYYPTIKIAFLVSAVANAISEKLTRLSSLGFMPKPTTLKDFILLEQAIEESDCQARLAKDVTISDFLELISWQKKTCLLALQNELTEEKGLIYFEHGVLYDAVYADFRAEQAVIEMLHWQYAKFVFKTLANKKFARQIPVSLSALLKKANEKMADVFFTPEELTGETELIATALPEQDEPPASLEAEMVTELQARFAEAAIAEHAMQQLAVKIQALEVARVLQPLQEINNYQAFVIFDMTGDVVIKHSMPALEFELEQISSNMAMIVKTIAKLLRDTGLKKFNFMQMNFDAGLFEAMWLVENQLVAAVLLTPKAQNPGLAKAHLDKVCDFIRNKL